MDIKELQKREKAVNSFMKEIEPILKRANKEDLSHFLYITAKTPAGCMGATNTNISGEDLASQLVTSMEENENNKLGIMTACVSYLVRPQNVDQLTVFMNALKKH